MSLNLGDLSIFDLIDDLFLAIINQTKWPLYFYFGV